MDALGFLKLGCMRYLYTVYYIDGGWRVPSLEKQRDVSTHKLSHVLPSKMYFSHLKEGLLKNTDAPRRDIWFLS